MKCVVCKSGETRQGTTTVTFEREGLTLVVKEVPAEICMNCGEDYVDESVAHEIMMLAENMAKSGTQVDIRRYVPGSVTC
jgi:YgiT-type zinc finger domain-containing protein